MRDSLIIIISYKIDLIVEVVKLPMLTRAHLCLPMLTHAHPCLPMPTHAHPKLTQLR